ncbi:MAG: gamma-glutamylcyclotransferase [Nitrospinaceae bacterium]|nr:gamma-glutamylcyclotransferase [Nitrospinaceae bacterium]NIR54548.1 gamma-glutamylcyclotransferase [Nitrospinaceae bacterium]NIS84967.1 gamma-glutamylcyclotransferase [Nitrospinaceae bacterium]NIT81781.1 gamma-glutamylcyclotransferase [Nitrospinaceae bacterium]NIU44050.1 gamma-glutamylcyclotransferase [Nitrospinaceae bacterium]
MLYFSYGSNMSIKRFLKRIPSAKKVAAAQLSNHELKFHKKSTRDGSAKCDIAETYHPEKIVFGVVFDIDGSGKYQLDQNEGLGKGYEEKIVEVLSEGNVLEAITYYATHIDPSLKPYSWYKEHVLRGAKENNFPDEYIQYISGIETIEDPDPKRHADEMAIYR